VQRDFVRVLETLARHDVAFVLIGGLAATVLGSPSVTSDVDVCYDRSWANLERLATALHAMGASPRESPEHLPFPLDAQALRNGDTFTFETTFGDVDIIGTPSGTTGYETLRANAERIELDAGLVVWVCSLEDLIRMKTAAGRPKDRIELEVLGALRDELEGNPE
jgi:hypothetical protein